jgi:hypothetical protein
MDYWISDNVRARQAGQLAKTLWMLRSCETIVCWRFRQGIWALWSKSTSQATCVPAGRSEVLKMSLGQPGVLQNASSGPDELQDGP